MLENIVSPVRLGLILDLTLRHHANGRRLVDLVKEQLISIVSKLESDDQCYLLDSWPLEDKPVGWYVAKLSTFEPIRLNCHWEGVMEGLSYKLSVGDGVKAIFFITDRHQMNPVFKLSLRWAEVHCVKFNYIYLGEQSDEDAEKLCLVAGVIYNHLQAENLQEYLLRFLKEEYERTCKCNREPCETIDSGRQETGSPG